MTARTILDEMFLTSRSVPNEHGCWIWSGYVNPWGYPVVGVDYRKLRVNRVAWELTNGPIPDEMTVDHICFVTTCVNPAHLQLLTRSQNSRRKQSLANTHCRNGHEFTSDNVRPHPQTGTRVCIACNRAAVARYKARKAEQ